MTFSIHEITHCAVDPENFNGFNYHILVNGRDPYTGKTAEEFKADGLQIVAWENLEKMIAEREDAMCGEWKEVTLADYEDALNVLPPLAWHSGGFYVGEPCTSNIHGFYQEYNGRYYYSLQRTSTPRAEILKSLLNYMNGRDA